MAKTARTSKRKKALSKKRQVRRPARAAGPRSQVLPEMDAVRDGKLDNICEGIGDERDAMNTAKVQEKSLLASALQRMVDRNISVYKHARVELVLVPGAAKVRCRITKDEGDASVTGGTTTSDNPDIDDENGDEPGAGA